MPPSPATHCENVLPELQANAPGVQGPVRSVAKADAEEARVLAMVMVALDTSQAVVDVEKVVGDKVDSVAISEKVGSCDSVVESEGDDDVVLEEAGDCEELVDGLSRDVVVGKTGGSGEDVGETSIVVGAVTVAKRAEEKRLVREADTDCVGVTNIVVAIIRTFVRHSVDVVSIVAVDEVVLRSIVEDTVVVTLAYGPGVDIAGAMVVAVLFGA